MHQAFEAELASNQERVDSVQRVRVCLCIWVSVCVCECVSLCVCIWVSVCVCECVSMCVCVSESQYVSVCECVSLCVCVSEFQYVSVNVCVSMCVCVCVSAHVYSCLCMYIFCFLQVGMEYIDSSHYASQQIGSCIDSLNSDWQTLLEKWDMYLNNYYNSWSPTHLSILIPSIHLSILVNPCRSGDKGQKLKQVRELQVFEQEVKDIEEWISDMEKQLKSHDLGRDLISVNNLLKSHNVRNELYLTISIADHVTCGQSECR